jgi:putative redox protein
MAETRVTVQLLEGMRFRGANEGGLTMIMDSPPEDGGAAAGPTPMEVVAMALGGCTGMDVISILRKMRQDVSSYEVHVSGPRAEAHPRVFTSLDVEHVVSGPGLNPVQVRRAVELSATRYCSASAMLSKAVPMVHRFRVLAADGAEVATGVIGEPAAEPSRGPATNTARQT